MKRLTLILLVAGWSWSASYAQRVLFDFDGTPAHSPLPVTITAGGVTANLTGTGQSFSIQSADVLGFTPYGFGGNCVYPDSVFAADLLISFSQPVTDFSILYAPEEYACDSSARMKVTASWGGRTIGTATATADPPGTWPTATLSFTSLNGFDHVVVHYDAPPPTGGDWGPIFMADNMRVTPMLIGDANNDSAVNFADLLILAQHYGKAGDVTAGDFNADGSVAFDDLLLLAQHYGQVAMPATAAPEPTAIVVTLAAIASVARGRRGAKGSGDDRDRSRLPVVPRLDPL